MVVSKIIVQEKAGNQYVYAYIPTEIARYLGVNKINSYVEWFPSHGSLVMLRAFPLAEAKKILSLPVIPVIIQKTVIKQKSALDTDLL